MALGRCQDPSYEYNVEVTRKVVEVAPRLASAWKENSLLGFSRNWMVEKMVTARKALTS